MVGRIPLKFHLEFISFKFYSPITCLKQTNSFIPGNIYQMNSFPEIQNMWIVTTKKKKK
jgi:hypothetical protein